MATYPYPVRSDSRWDNIASKAYGDASNIDGIVDANPDVLIGDIIPAGTVLDIPILPQITVDTPVTSLPPWLR